MARIAIVTPRQGLVPALIAALRRLEGVELCEQVEVAQLDGRFDTLVCMPAGDADGARGLDLSNAPDLLSLRHVVAVSSAAIYGADHHHTGRLHESTFVSDHGSPAVRSWVAFEMAASHVAGSHAELTVLRPSAILDGHGFVSQLLRRRHAATYPGHDPTLQVLDGDDLAGAVAAVVSGTAAGVYNVAPAAGMPLKAALRAAGVTRVPLPRVPQSLVRRPLSDTGLMAAPETLEYLRYSWTVAGDRLTSTTRFRPSTTSAEAVARFAGARGRSADGSAFDEYGMDAAYIRRYCGHLFHLLHDYYWRVELQGLEHVPRHGRGVLVGVHRGFMPFDGVMALYALVRHTGRIPRFLIHPSLTKFPFLADFMAKLGGLMACVENGDWVLERDELLGVFPEGIRGAFTMYDRAYTLGRFGRDEFVRMALRNRAPILPFVTVGSAEIYPILKRIDWPWFKRYTEWPFLPVTPAPFPLPSKWHTQFLAPMHVERDHPPDAANDPVIVSRISAEVRRRMQAAIDAMLSRRRRVFTGSIFEEAGA